MRHIITADESGQSMAVFVDTITERPYSAYGTSTVEMQNTDSTTVPERDLDPEVRHFERTLPADAARPSRRECGAPSGWESRWWWSA